MEYPERPRSHELEGVSRRFFEAALPVGWTVDRPQNDYGSDLSVRIFENGRATNLEFLVQLKASEARSGRDVETAELRVATYNYLWDLLPVVMLIKYVVPDNESYWILLRDVPTPSQDKDSFTVHFPRENRLSSIDWDEIKGVVRDVTNRKLGAQRLHDEGKRPR